MPQGALLADTLGAELDPAAPRLADHAWEEWDWRIDRPQLVSVYLTRSFQPEDPFREYLRYLRYTAAVDSLGLADFLPLPATERSERRAMAREHLAKAQRFRRLIDRVWELNQEGYELVSGIPAPSSVAATQRVRTPGTGSSEVRPAESRIASDLASGLFAPPPPGAGSALTRALGHLINACGLDPSEPWAWYDLEVLARAVGDRSRARTAVAAAWAALDNRAARGEIGPDDPLLRFRLTLDIAWLDWESGRRADSLRRLDRADSLILAGHGRTYLGTREALTLRGLVLAESGEFSGAQGLAGQVDQLKVWVRNKTIWTSPRSSDLVRRALDKRSWERRDNDILGRWIMARAYLALDDSQEALRTLGKPNVMIELPPGWSARFWNDAGHIYEACGAMEDARLAHAMAAAYGLYFIYYPMIGARGMAAIDGLPGAGRTYFLTYHHLYLAGSLYSYAANAALAFEIEKDPQRRAELARRARWALDACERRGIQPSAVKALRGRLRYFLADDAGAEQDLRAAYTELRESEIGEHVPSALLLGLLHFNRREYHAALPWLERFVTVEPTSAFAWRSLGLARIFAGQSDSALAAFDRAVALDPQSVYGWYNRGLLHLSRNRPEAARPDLERAAALAPEEAEIAHMARLAANDALQRVQLTPTTIELHTSRADSAAAAEWYDQAGVNLGEELTGSQPTDDEPGAAFLGRDPESLVAELEAVHAADPTLESRRNLAWAYLRTDRARDARRLLLQDAAREVPAADLRLVLEAERHLGDDVRALRLVQTLADGAEPLPDPRIWALVAVICLDHDRREEARLALDEALRLDPANASLQQLRRQTVGGGR